MARPVLKVDFVQSRSGIDTYIQTYISRLSGAAAGLLDFSDRTREATFCTVFRLRDRLQQ